MPDEYTFRFGGVSAESVGLRLQEPIRFSAPIPDVKRIPVAGRNGDLTIDMGSFKNRTGTAKCFALQSDVESAVAGINRMLFWTTGYRELICSDDPDHYWMAQVTNGAELRAVRSLLAPFKIKFDVMPQRFRQDGKKVLTFLPSAQSVSVRNDHAMVAEPIIKVYGNGAGTLQLGRGANMAVVKIRNLQTALWIDSLDMRCYDDQGGKDQDIEADDFPKLYHGSNWLRFDGGITKVEITPRWADL